MSLDSIETALEALAEGRMIVVVDDENRENEGDLVCAADAITPEQINFMATHARGLICLALPEERVERLELPMQERRHGGRFDTAFTVSIEAREGVTTGISAQDRATTVQVAMDDTAQPSDLVTPGHVFPIKARRGGTLVRSGHTEAAVDLTRLAGRVPGGVICEVMNADGTMARLPQLVPFATEHGLPLISIEDLIEYRATHESIVRHLVRRKIEHPQWGDVELHVYGTDVDRREHLAVVKGDLRAAGSAPLVRVHAGYPFSNVFGDLFSQDRQVLNAALKRLSTEPRGVLLCLDHGLGAPPLHERVERLGTTVENPTPSVGAVQKEIGIGAQILRHLGLREVRLLTTRPRRLMGLSGHGLEVEEVVQLEVEESR